MVLSISVCPSHSCTVRRSTPWPSALVAKVALNLCSQYLFSSRPPRLATALTQSQKSIFGLQPEVGNSGGHRLSVLAIQPSRISTNASGIGILRSLYHFGDHFLGASLCFTRTVRAFRFTLDRKVKRTSCSPSPVIRKKLNSDILRLVARPEKRVQLLWLVPPVPLRCSGAVLLANQAGNAVPFQE